MIFSPRYGYMMIANQKVASESMHLVAGPDAQVCFPLIGKEKHATLDEVAAIFDDVGLKAHLADCFLFTMVREPAEWYVSWYNSRAREPLANPDHKRHDVWTGDLDFDAFLELGRQSPMAPPARVKPQAKFTKAPDGLRVHALPFDEIDTLFPRLFPEASRLSQFRLNKPAHHTNKSRIVRITARDLTEKQRRSINEEIWPRDYEIYLKAKDRAAKLKPVTAPAPHTEAIARAVQGDPAMLRLAAPTAFAHAQTLLHEGQSEADVRQSLSRFAHVDIDATLAEAVPRVRRLQGT